MWNFDFYISASIFEGLPTAIIEAKFSNIPIIARPCQGNIDVLSSTNSFLAQDMTNEAFYKNLKEIK